MTVQLFADVLLPLAIERMLTYRIPKELQEQATVGKRVVVAIGRSKLYSGIIYRIHDQVPDFKDVKEVQAVLDERPIVFPAQLEFWDWLTNYYMCQYGDVMNAAIPSAFRLQSETNLVLHSDFKEEFPEDLNADEEVIYNLLLERDSISVQDIQRIFPGNAAQKKLKRLVERGIVIMSEELGERYKPLKEIRIQLSDTYQKESSLETLFLQLEQDTRKHKQLETLLSFLQFLYNDKSKKYVRKKDLTRSDKVSTSSIQTLIRNGILTEFEVVVDRLQQEDIDLSAMPELTKVQQQSLNEIRSSWKKLDTVLLHGVTSSGKTELYIRLIQETIERGEQVLYLLPEIALTTQIIQRLRKYFGHQVGVYHSRYSSNERVEVWNQVLDFYGNPSEPVKSQIVLGARSALFLPFTKLGLVIIDEEHDSSYKQQDPAPRYHARDASMMLARQQGAKVLLGSATPSLESYFNAKQGKYGLVKLNERYGGTALPEIIIADIKEATRKRLMKSHFSPDLLEAVKMAIDSKEQVILFQNRRGFSPYLECKMCDWIPHCRNCSVTLTYHKATNQLKCHYCGFVQQIPSACQQCGDPQISIKGFGTEKIEEEIGIFFPDLIAGRLDLDTANTRTSFQRILSDFDEGRISILVGTQMVSKGLDFGNVSLVGVLDADQMINFPDFRAHERSFQLMSQVSGRSGRRDKRGKVIIQTRQPHHWVIRDVVKHDYESFYIREIEDRSHFGYPPFSRLITLTFRHKDENEVHEVAMEFSKKLKLVLGDRIHGPHIPLVNRIRNKYLRIILIKIPKNESAAMVKQLLSSMIINFKQQQNHSSFQIVPDVDPV